MSITRSVQTTLSLWDRTLAQLIPLMGRFVSVEIAARDGWLVAVVSGTRTCVDVVSMKGGAGGEDARLDLVAGVASQRIWLSENDVLAVAADRQFLEVSTADVVLRFDAL